MLPLLRDKDENVRAATAQAVGNIGPNARAAVSGLGLLLNDKVPAVSTSATEALGKMGKAGIPGLVYALKSKEEGLRVAGSLGLAKLGPDAAAAAPDHLAALNGEDNNQ